MTTVAEIAERALRRLGVAVVPVAERPELNTKVAPGDIATNALIELGVIATDEVPASQATVVAVDTIATTALIKLGVIASDETPSTTDLALARAAVTAVHDALVGQGSVEWLSTQITTAVAEEYAALTALHLASSFGKVGDPQALAVMEGRIAAVSRVQRAHNLALSKVQQVQASLASQANVTWDNTGVPTAIAEEYTRLTAMQLASSFGVKVDPQMLAVWEARARRLAMILAGPGSAEDAVQAVHDDLVARGVARWTVWDIPPAAELPIEMLAANRLAALFEKQANPNDELLARRSLAQITALESSGERVRADYF